MGICKKGSEKGFMRKKTSGSCLGFSLGLKEKDGTHSSVEGIHLHYEGSRCLRMTAGVIVFLRIGRAYGHNHIT